MEHFEDIKRLSGFKDIPAEDESPDFIKAINDLYFWQYPQSRTHSPSFYQDLFSLLHKADPQNKFRLWIAFPDHARAYQLWKDSTSQDEFFDTYKNVIKALQGGQGGQGGQDVH
jgi:hypothetical protein